MKIQGSPTTFGEAVRLKMNTPKVIKLKLLKTHDNMFIHINYQQNHIETILELLKTNFYLQPLNAPVSFIGVHRRFFKHLSSYNTKA